MGTLARRSARSQMRATSRWLVKRILPALAKRTRTRGAGPVTAGLRRGAGCAGSRARRLAGGRSTGPAPCPGRRRARGGAPRRGGEPPLAGGALPVLPQEVLVETGREVVPGQDLVLGAVAVHVPLEVEAVLGQGVEPQVEPEVLAPLLERAAPAPHGLDDRAQAAVAPGGQALDQGGLRVGPGELHALGRAGAVAQQRDLAAQLLGRVLPEPLERGEGL